MINMTPLYAISPDIIEIDIHSDSSIFQANVLKSLIRRRVIWSIQFVTDGTLFPLLEVRCSEAISALCHQFAVFCFERKKILEQKLQP